MKVLVGVFFVGLLFFGLPLQPAEAALTCGGKAATIVGTNGNDVINGTSGDDVIIGRDGNDIINGKGGNDRICGGNGDDIIIGGNGSDKIWGNGGIDVIRGGNGRDWLYGGPGGDKMFGGKGNDELRGFKNGDLMFGGPGTDKMYGGAGNDIADGGAGSDTSYGGLGTDACFNTGIAFPNTCEASTLTTTWANWNLHSDLPQLTYSETDWNIDGWWNSYPSVNGEQYQYGIGSNFTSYTDVGDSATYEYDLGRDYRRFTATIGVVDNAKDTDVVYRFEVFGDDVPLSSTTIGFGQQKYVKVDISNVLRMKLRITVESVGGSYVTGSYNYVLWLNPRISANTKLPVARAL